MKEKQTKPSILELNIEDFRAIKEANIKLDGITVVTGENSSGKSTLSKLLYYSIKISKQYDDFLKNTIRDNLIKIGNFISLLNVKNDDLPDKFYKEIEKDIIQNKNNIISILKEYLEDTLQNSEKIDKREFYRFKSIFLKYFEEYTKELKDKNDEIELDELSQIIENVVEKFYEKIEEKIKERNKKFLQTKLKNFYPEKLKNFSIYEYSFPIISHESQRLDDFQSIEHIIYVDSPMAVENDEYEFWEFLSLKIDKFSHWGDLDYHLKNENKQEIEKIRENESYQQIKELFSSREILNGEINLEQDKLIFNRKDGKSFKVSNCATGIKSIAALQMLHQNGWLTNKTLLILDEPETHLHPQWVVEYARLIVLLNKKIGVNFFISSHHPDMISAIQDICDKEDSNDKLRFYLAEKDEKGYQYQFTDQGINVENIFDSFNIAIERINEYGGVDE